MIRIDTAAIDELFKEIGRYFEAVDVFRREGREPRWSDAPVQEEVLR
jgi:hypothetical protein